MHAFAAIHVLCETHSSVGTAVVNGLLAWAGVLGGCTVAFSGLPAAVALLIPSRAESLLRRVNRGLGQGFVVGMAGGFLLFCVFVAKVVQ